VIFQFIFKYVFTYAFFNKRNAFFRNIKIIQTFIYLFNPYLSSYTGQIRDIFGNSFETTKAEDFMQLRHLFAENLHAVE